MMAVVVAVDLVKVPGDFRIESDDYKSQQSRDRLQRIGCASCSYDDVCCFPVVQRLWWWLLLCLAHSGVLRAPAVVVVASGSRRGRRGRRGRVVVVVVVALLVDFIEERCRHPVTDASCLCNRAVVAVALVAVVEARSRNRRRVLLSCC